MALSGSGCTTLQPTIESTDTAAIYPAGSVVPDTLVRLYVRFPKPMARGAMQEHLSLRAEDGQELRESIRHTARELWDPTGRQLTVLLNPGRNKSGVGPNRSYGPSLPLGATVTLAVKEGWPFRDGGQLEHGAARTYDVLELPGGRIDPSRWELSQPRAESRDPLRVVFKRPLDRFLVERSITLWTASGEVQCKGHIEDSGTEIELTPVQPWGTQRHWLRIDPRLEDLAGNNLLGSFESAVAEPVPHRDSEVVEVDVPVLTAIR